MKRKQKNNKFILAMVIILLGMLGAIWIVRSLSINPNINNKIYDSKSLQISFEYPNEWYVTENPSELIITNYRYNPHKNYIPKNDEIEVHINEKVLCNKSLEEDIIMWGCGEGNQVANKILEKQIRQFPSGKFSSYLIYYPQNNLKQKVYFLEKGQKVLQITKNNKEAHLEKEFIEIIRSIRFSHIK